MNLHCKVLILSVCLFAISATTHAQVNLRKLRQKAEQAIDKTVDKAISKELGLETGSKDGNNPTSNNPNSIDGKGKKLTPPDVNMHIAQANEAITQDRLSDAKFEIQQAILGVELEIGYDILENLPKTINGMNFKEDDDQVSSAGVGFIGFTIGRYYNSGNKALSFGIISNNILVTSYSSMLTNAGYTSSEGDYKRVNIDGNQGVIQYKSGNYELGIPLGQSSIIVLDCDGFADESEVLSVAKQLNINDIKKKLGEQ